ncbi:MAG: hypothetical protein IT285_00745 [Bdellovibrionales bacterium]|nr:hypothetical protein [Bdellovibrionales bacterium]
MVATLFNFTLFVGLIYFAVRTPVRRAVVDRHATIRDTVETNRRRLADARAAYEEYSSKLRAVDIEAGAVRQQLKVESEAARERVIQAAKRLSAGILVDAETGAKGVFEDLRNRLMRQFAAQVVSRAQGAVREKLTGDVKARIRQEFSSQMESAR